MEKHQHFIPLRQELGKVIPYPPPISLFSAWNIYLEEAINAKKWNPIKVSRSGPLLSHLMFAYDLFLFARADSKIRIV